MDLPISIIMVNLITSSLFKILGLITLAELRNLAIKARGKKPFISVENGQEFMMWDEPVGYISQISDNQIEKDDKNSGKILSFQNRVNDPVSSSDVTDLELLNWRKNHKSQSENENRHNAHKGYGNASTSVRKISKEKSSGSSEARILGVLINKKSA